MHWIYSEVWPSAKPLLLFLARKILELMKFRTYATGTGDREALLQEALRDR